MVTFVVALFSSHNEEYHKEEGARTRKRCVTAFHFDIFPLPLQTLRALPPPKR